MDATLDLHAASGTLLHARRTVTVARPAAELYAFWRNVENYPAFLGRLERVAAGLEDLSHWVFRTPLGLRVRWNSQVVLDQPGERLGWRTTTASRFHHAGEVEFRPGPRGTLVTLSLRYVLPGGPVLVPLARALGLDPAQEVAADLARFKQLMEAGELATTLGQPSGRRTGFKDAWRRRLENLRLPAAPPALSAGASS